MQHHPILSLLLTQRTADPQQPDPTCHFPMYSHTLHGVTVADTNVMQARSEGFCRCRGWNGEMQVGPWGWMWKCGCVAERGMMDVRALR
jgi:hypothetical protein